MRAFYLRIALGVLRATKRFISNQPTNQYEEVVFSAIRAMATIFGRKAHPA